MDLNQIDLLLKKFSDGTCSAEEKEWVELWLIEHEHTTGQWAEMNESSRNSWLSELYIDLEKSIDTNKNIPIKALWYHSRSIKYVASIAAILLLVFGSLYYSYHTKFTGSEQLVNIEVKNGERRFIKLSDGTKVWLNSASTIKYAPSFHSKVREVYLIGEAYFEVAHEANRPFVVHAGNTLTKVLGTHFTVKAYNEDSQVEIALLSGKVEVSKSIKGKVYGDALTLKPAEVAIYGITQQTLAKRKEPAIGDYTKWTAEKLVFEDTPLTEVLDKLSKTYRVKFKMPEAKFNQCTFTGSFSAENGLETILKSMSVAIDGIYTINDDLVTLDGTGCNK